MFEQETRMLQAACEAASLSGWAAFRLAGLWLSSDTLDGGDDPGDDDSVGDDTGDGTPLADAPEVPADVEPAAPEDVPVLTPVRSVLTPRQG
jgi:hypothetical protein